MNFRVGQKVVCVDMNTYGRLSRWKGERVPNADQVYTIRAVFVSDDGLDEVGVLLEEIRNPINWTGQEFGFLASRFRPVVERKTDISTFTKILDDVNAGRVREVVTAS